MITRILINSSVKNNISANENKQSVRVIAIPRHFDSFTFSGAASLRQDKFSSFIRKILDVILPDKYSFNDFKKWMVKSGLTPEKLLETALKEDRFIGEVDRYNVYKIPGNKKYVLRFHKGIENHIGELRPVQDELPKHNFGQPIAEMGTYKIHKRLFGIEGGIPDRAKDEKANFYITKHLARCGNLPQSAYDEFADTLKLLNRHSLAFDSKNPNKILIKMDKPSILIVGDLNKTHFKNTVCNMVDPLITQASILVKNEYRPDLIKYRQSILKKCIIASVKADLPLPDEFDETMMHAFKISGLPSNWFDVYSFINVAKSESISNKQLIKDLSNFLDDMFKPRRAAFT